MKKSILTIPQGDIHTNIWIGVPPEEMVFDANRTVIVTDENLLKEYKRYLERLPISEPIILPIPPGEASKSRKMKEMLEDEMLQRGLGRDTSIIAFGGGVVTDLAGFLASTYCRGLPLYLIPTSLLAMVDASIGGKTAVNTSFGKNLIGSFYHPKAIYIEPTLLQTLSEKEMREGKAEIIKHAIIADATLFSLLEKSFDDMEMIIGQNILIKSNIVKADAKEEGTRTFLNFGHTLGHSIENASNYQVSHGTAVAIGMLGEAFLSHKLGHLSREDLERIRSLIRKVKFPLTLPPSITKEKLLQGMKLDKKSIKNRPRFVIIKKIGEVVGCHPVENKLIEQMIDEQIYCKE